MLSFLYRTGNFFISVVHATGYRLFLEHRAKNWSGKELDKSKKSSSTRPRCVKMQPRTLRREARQKAQPYCFCISIDGGGITLFGTFLKQLQT